MDLRQLVITDRMLKLVAEVDEFKGYWNGIQDQIPVSLQPRKDAATVASIGASTRIEGSKLTDRQVGSLIQELGTRLYRTRDEQDVAGCAKALRMVLDRSEDLALTENNIKHLHNELCQYSPEDEGHRGEYKKRPNSVVAMDAEGNVIGVVLETSSPEDTPGEMAELVKWACEHLDNSKSPYSMHPLLVIGVFKVVFLAIHPFEDGNGRLSRLLTTLLLLRAGYGYVPYTSSESLIEERRGIYYISLRSTQTTLKSDEQKWEPWLDYFLRILSKQKDAIKDVAQELIAYMGNELPQECIAILECVRREGRITTKRAFELLGIPRPTVRRRLEELVESGNLIARGKGKGTYYVSSKWGVVEA